MLQRLWGWVSGNSQSATGTPASTCFGIAMIWLWVNGDCFVCRSLWDHCESLYSKPP